MYLNERCTGNDYPSRTSKNQLNLRRVYIHNLHHNFNVNCRGGQRLDLATQTSFVIITLIYAGKILINKKSWKSWEKWCFAHFAKQMHSLTLKQLFKVRRVPLLKVISCRYLVFSSDKCLLEREKKMESFSDNFLVQEHSNYLHGIQEAVKASTRTWYGWNLIPHFHQQNKVNLHQSY